MKAEEQKEPFSIPPWDCFSQMEKKLQRQSKVAVDIREGEAEWHLLNDGCSRNRQEIYAADKRKDKFATCPFFTQTKKKIREKAGPKRKNRRALFIYEFLRKYIRKLLFGLNYVI